MPLLMTEAFLTSEQTFCEPEATGIAIIRCCQVI